MGCTRFALAWKEGGVERNECYTTWDAAMRWANSNLAGVDFTIRPLQDCC